MNLEGEKKSPRELKKKKVQRVSKESWKFPFVETLTRLWENHRHHQEQIDEKECLGSSSMR